MLQALKKCLNICLFVWFFKEILGLNVLQCSIPVCVVGDKQVQKMNWFVVVDYESRVSFSIKKHKDVTWYIYHGVSGAAVLLC